MKRMFKFFLAFDSADGSKTVAEFSSHGECMSFKEELDQSGQASKLVNERDCQALRYKGAQYLDMRD